MKFYMWSSLHYFMMLCPFLISLILYLYSKDKDDEIKRKLGIYLSFVAIFLLIARNIEIFFLRGYRFDFELVPLQVCHFANFVMLYAYIKRSDVVFGFAFLFNMPLAFLSLLFADGLANYSNILTWRGQAYIWGHILIVGITFFGYTVGFVKLNFQKYLRISAIISFLVVLSTVVNNLFRIYLDQRANYFYTEHPEAGTPLELIYNLGKVQFIGGFEINTVYVLTLAFGGPLLIYVFYFLIFELPILVRKSEKNYI